MAQSNKKFVVFLDLKQRPLRSKSQYKTTKDVTVEQTLLDKGKIITDVRNSDDLYQAVKDRLCLWPTGDEIISLLMLLQSDQISESYRPSAFEPKFIVPTIIAETTDEPTMNSGKSSGSRKMSVASEYRRGTSSTRLNAKSRKTTRSDSHLEVSPMHHLGLPSRTGSVASSIRSHGISRKTSVASEYRRGTSSTRLNAKTRKTIGSDSHLEVSPMHHLGLPSQTGSVASSIMSPGNTTRSISKTMQRTPMLNKLQPIQERNSDAKEGLLI